MYRYCVIVEQLTSEDGKHYFAYGVRLRGRKEKVSDVTLDLYTAKHIVRLCNSARLSPKRLECFIRNYIDN